MEYTHQSVRAFIAATKSGDHAEAARIATEITARFNSRPAHRNAMQSELDELASARAAIARSGK